MAHSRAGATSLWSAPTHHVSDHPAQREPRLTWLLVLLAVYVVLGFRRPGRMGSTHVTILVASAIVLGWVFVGLGS